MKAVTYIFLLMLMLLPAGCAPQTQELPPQPQVIVELPEQPEATPEATETENTPLPGESGQGETLPTEETMSTEETADTEETAPTTVTEPPAAAKVNSGFVFDRASGTITGYTGPGGEVVIPAKIDGAAVKHIGEDAFHGNRDITSVVIAEGITSIGNGAFGECDQLASVSIPPSAKTIGEWSFYRIPLASLTIPEGVESIGEGAFSMCGGLTSVTIPGSVKDIGGNAFYVCINLTTVTIQPGVKSIGRGAFRSCDNLTEVEIPPGVESIGELAFELCNKLKRIFLPASVKNIGGGILYSSSETTLELDSANPYFILEDGVLFNTARTELLYCSPQKSGWYNIPAGVTEIGAYAFGNCALLSGITIPASVTSLGDYIFLGCTANEIRFEGDRPSFSGAFWGAFGVERIFYAAGAAGWPGETIVTEKGEIVPEALK